MNSGVPARTRLPVLSLLIAALAFLTVPQAAFPQASATAGATAIAGTAEQSPAQQQPGVSASQADAAAPNVASDAIPAAQAAEGTGGTPAAAGAGFPYYGPEMIKGLPVSGAFGFQPQYTDDGLYAERMHDYILVPMMFGISILVLFLLFWVVGRYNARANKVPSRTSHNTLIEVIWTLVPVLILVVIAVPSITLLARQYRSPGEDAVTIKVTGYQWYWGYTYPDNGGFEVISNMKEEGAALAAGEPPHLAVDNRMVVPVGTELRIQTTGSDVIHAFGIPSLWFKLDAVPGRLNERRLVIKEPGIYYGQCMELCGARHGYMPIAIEARPRAEFEAWIRSKGGTASVAGKPAAPVTATGLQEPESSVEGAPGAGAPPTTDTGQPAGTPTATIAPAT